ncbi:protein mab-21-like 3 [Mytilus trossulus]|uniref:protein mab-21-like 3 n=1 Tax=Mytilus trossulus TaxID=6551 RepID=UPI003003DA49
MARHNGDLYRMFQSFYHEHVQMNRDETKRNANVVRDVVEKILEYVNGLDSRFQKEPEQVGSFHSFTKVSGADEFDYSILFNTGMEHSWSDLNQPALYAVDAKHRIVKSAVPLRILPMKYTLKTHNRGPNSMSENGCLVPLTFKRHFRQLVLKAVDYLTKNSKINQTVIVKPLSDSPAVTITVKQRGRDELNVDLAPMINTRLPFKDEFGWPNHRAQWPAIEKNQQLKHIKVNLVTSDRLYWKLSFAICERELLVDIDRDGSGTCRRRSLRIMKRLRELFWCSDQDDRDGLTSYHLKNLLFYECERLPNDYQIFGKSFLFVIFIFKGEPV